MLFRHSTGHSPLPHLRSHFFQSQTIMTQNECLINSLLRCTSKVRCRFPDERETLFLQDQYSGQQYSGQRSSSQSPFSSPPWRTKFSKTGPRLPPWRTLVRPHATFPLSPWRTKSDEVTAPSMLGEFSKTGLPVSYLSPSVSFYCPLPSLSVLFNYEVKSGRPDAD